MGIKLRNQIGQPLHALLLIQIDDFHFMAGENTARHIIKTDGIDG